MRYSLYNYYKTNKNTKYRQLPSLLKIYNFNSKIHNNYSFISRKINKNHFQPPLFNQNSNNNFTSRKHYDIYSDSDNNINIKYNSNQYPNSLSDDINNEINFIKFRMGCKLLNHKLNKIQQYAKGINTLNDDIKNLNYKDKDKLNNNITDNKINNFGYCVNTDFKRKKMNENYLKNKSLYNNIDNKKKMLIELSDFFNDRSNEKESVYLNSTESEVGDLLNEYLNNKNKNSKEKRSKNIKKLKKKYFNENIKINSVDQFELPFSKKKDFIKTKPTNNLSVTLVNNFVLNDKINTTPQKEKIKKIKHKKISFDPNNIIINYDQNKKVTNLIIHDEKGEFKHKNFININKYIRKLKTNKKIKGILLNCPVENYNDLTIKNVEKQFALEKLVNLLDEIGDDEGKNKDVEKKENQINVKLKPNYTSIDKFNSESYKKRKKVIKKIKNDDNSIKK